MLAENKAIYVWKALGYPMPVNMFAFGEGWAFVYICNKCKREYVSPRALEDEPAVCLHCRKGG